MELQKALKLFKSYLLTERGYSEGTCKEYSRDVERLYEFHNQTDIQSVDSNDIREWLTHLVSNKDISLNTRNRKLASIRTWFKYLLKGNTVTENPAMSIDIAKVKKKAEPFYLKVDQVKSLINAIEGRNKIRDKAIIKVFVYGGLRVEELVKLNKDNIKNNRIKFIGKGNKERIVPLHPQAKKSLQQWFSIREDDSKALFVSNRRQRISIRQVQRLVKKHAAKSRIKNNELVSCHKLRSTFATLVYDQNKDIKTLKNLMGHSDISTTQLYLGNNKEIEEQNVNALPNF